MNDATTTDTPSTTGTPSPTAGSPTSGIAAVIMEDHRMVERMFDQLRSSWSADTARLLVSFLAQHSAAEEQVVYPAVEACLDDAAAPGASTSAGDELEAHGSDIDQAMLQHHPIKELLAELDGDVESPRSGLLSELRDAVMDHVADEEGTVLPFLTATMSPGEAEELARRFEQEKASAPTRPHPMAPGKGIAGKIAATLAAPIDEARDAMEDARKERTR